MTVQSSIINKRNMELITLFLKRIVSFIRDKKNVLKLFWYIYCYEKFLKRMFSSKR